MTTTRNLTSILGHASQLYRSKRNETGSILDSPEKGLLELYPAGYTKPSNRDGQSRQELYKALYEIAVSKGAEGNLYPFEKDTHNITLLPDPSNPFDEHAVHLILEVSNVNSPLYHLNGRDLGFIPKKINQNILRGIDIFNGGRILKVKCNYHKKFYGAKVILAYADTHFDARPGMVMSLSRFADILEEE